MSKVPYIGQLTQTECGLCSVAMLLGYYGRHVKVSDLRVRYEIGRDGLKLSELNSVLQENGMDTHIYKAKFKHLTNDKCPMIAFWENKHFVVIESITDKEVKVVDSALGRVKLSHEEAEERFSGFILTATPNENFQKTPKPKNVWFNYAYLLFNNKGLFIKVLLLSLLSYVFTILTPMFIQTLIDSAVSGQQTFLTSGSYVKIFGLLFGAIVVYTLILFLSGQKTLDYSRHIDNSINRGLFGRILQLPSKFFEIRSSGDILFRVQSLSLIRDMFAQKVIRFIMNIGAILVILGYIAHISKILALCCIGYFVLSGVAIIYTRKKVLETNQSEIVEMSKLQAIQTEMIYSISDIKLTATEDAVYDKWDKQYQRANDKHYATQKFQNIHTTFINMINTLGPVLLFAIGMMLCAQGALTIGAVIAVYSSANTYMSLCVSTFTSIDDFLLSSQYIDRVREITEEPVEAVPEDPQAADCGGDIELNNISFSYTNHSPKVIDNVSMKIKSGQKIAIVGPSGSGKTTLGKLILGLYKATEGEVYYDGIRSDEIDKKEFRRHVGVVPQDMVLMNKSIQENITLDREDITDEMVREAAKYACIDDEIEAMPMKYNTIVSDMGTNISGGQKQRIALARALINKPKLLFLDEATSSLDAINEHIISSYVQGCGCTQVVIAHRISTVMDADKIFVMKDGHIAESGNHAELMAKEGLYSDLYHNQLSDLKCA